MTTVEQATADDLRALVARAAPAVTADDGLAERVLARAGRDRARRRRLRTVAVAVLVCGAVAAATLPGRSAHVYWTQPSGAMAPTVGIGQTVVVRRDAAPVRGDVVLLTFRTPQQDWDALSRVVGLPGDVVACPDDGAGRCAAVLVDGRPVDEPWVVQETAPFDPVEVASEEVFVLGDARGAANDSRFVGPQRLADVHGAVVARVTEGGSLERPEGVPSRPLPGGGAGIDPADVVPPARTG